MSGHPYRTPGRGEWGLAEWPKVGDRIAWRRDHLGGSWPNLHAFKVGTVRGVGAGVVYALPDERNCGPEPDGGTSEIRSLLDMRRLRPGEGRGRLPDLRLDFSIVEHGYQVDVLADVDLDNRTLTDIGGACRDFGFDQNVREARDALVKKLGAAIDEWRRELDERVRSAGQ